MWWHRRSATTSESDRRHDVSNGLRAALHIALVFLWISTASLAASPTEAALSFLKRSDVVFVGRVLDARSALNEDGRLILTHYYFSVEERLSLSGRRGQGWEKADGETIDVVEWGGTVGDTTMTLSHGVQYGIGRSYLVFLKKEGLGLRTVGGPIGAFEISTTGSGQRMIRLYRSHPLSGLAGGSPKLFQQVDELRARLMAALRGASQ